MITSDVFSICVENPYTLHYRNYQIKKVIFNDPATIVFWQDGTKTVVECMKGERFDPEKGLAMAISKGVLGNKFKKTFREWLTKKKIELQNKEN